MLALLLPVLTATAVPAPSADRSPGPFGPRPTGPSGHVTGTPSGHVAAAASPVAAVSPAAPGVVEGRVDLRLPPRRRTASRYGAREGRGAASIQDLPAVVYLRGAAGEGPAPVRAVMAQSDTTFSPPVLVVPVGSTVDFPNQDDFFHNVFSYSSPARFDLGRYPRGESKSVELPGAGVVKVYCEVHEFMRGAILVVDTPAWAIVGADGGFTLEGVPPGTWTVVAWHADLGEVGRSVTVRDGRRTRVDLILE